MSPSSWAWAALTAELDRWAADGRQASFWWRDDDAVRPTAALDQLQAVQAATAAPLALAVIPAQAEAGVAAILGAPRIAALQHGYAHTNHADAGAKKSEFPSTRPLDARLADVKAGRDALAALFGPATPAVFVPPWNRIVPDMLPGLAALGFHAVSAFKPRPAYWAAPGLAWLNTHLDPIDWHGGDHPAAATACLHSAFDLLRAMRGGESPLQPVGFLTHHLRHDAFLWDFTSDFISTVARHPACQWVDTATALAVGRPPESSPVTLPS